MANRLKFEALTLDKVKIIFDGVDLGIIYKEYKDGQVFWRPEGWEGAPFKTKEGAALFRERG